MATKATEKPNLRLAPGAPKAAGGPPAFDVVKGSNLYELADELRITPAPKTCGIAGPSIRFLSNGNGRSIITDVEIASNVVKRRAVHEPIIHRPHCNTVGFSVGYRQERRIGNPSTLFFLDNDAQLVGRRDLPDAASDIVPGLDGSWYAGCRNGAVYKFSGSGDEICRRPVGASNSSEIIPLFLTEATAPCPRIATFGSYVVVAEADHFELLTSGGEQLWKALLSGRKHQVQLVTDKPIRRKWFDIKLSIGGQLCGESITAVGVSQEFVCIGTSDGRLLLLDLAGHLVNVFSLSGAPISTILVCQQGLRAAYSGGLLAIFEQNKLRRAVKLPLYFAQVYGLGSDLLVWGQDTARVIDGWGRVLWKTLFVKQIRSVIVDEFGFSILAGPLYRFSTFQKNENANRDGVGRQG